MMKKKTSSVDWLVCKLPNINHAGVIAVNIASKINPKLTEQEEAIFIAGFQECVKYINTQVELIQQAKEMHEKEMEDIWDYARNVGIEESQYPDEESRETFLQYYNETYGSTKQN